MYQDTYCRIISNKANIPDYGKKRVKKVWFKKSEGEYESGKVVFIEDTITTGGSVNKFIQMLGGEGKK